MIVLDIDGVIANPFDEIDYRLSKLGYETRKFEERVEGYHWKDIYPDIPADVLKGIINDPLTIKNATAIESSWYWINHMSSTYDIMFLTARDPKLTDATWSWFFDWDIPADFVVFEKNKVEFLETIRDSIYVYVDDYPEMVHGAWDYGINAFMFNQPYNGSYFEVNDEIPRVSSLWEIPPFKF